MVMNVRSRVSIPTITTDSFTTIECPGLARTWCSRKSAPLDSAFSLSRAHALAIEKRASVLESGLRIRGRRKYKSALPDRRCQLQIPKRPGHGERSDAPETQPHFPTPPSICSRQQLQYIIARHRSHPHNKPSAQRPLLRAWSR